jgi:hypothetical protein
MCEVSTPVTAAARAGAVVHAHARVGRDVPTPARRSRDDACHIRVEDPRELRRDAWVVCASARADDACATCRERRAPGRAIGAAVSNMCEVSASVSRWCAKVPGSARYRATTRA